MNQYEGDYLPKKKTAPAIVTIGALLALVGAAGLFLYRLNQGKQPVVEKTTEKKVEIDVGAQIEPHIQKQKQLNRKVYELSRGEDVKAHREAFKEALAFNEELKQKWATLTAELRDSEGAYKANFEGYKNIDTQLHNLRFDLLKAKPIN